MKKYLKNMSYDDLKKIVQDNKTIRDITFDRAWGTAWNWCEDYLRGFPGRYEIGGQYDYLEISEDQYTWTYYNFEEWFNNVQKKYCLVNDEEEKIIRKFIHYAEIDHKIEYEVYAKDKDIVNVQKKVDELKEQSEQIILARLKSEYDDCYEDSRLADELDCMIYGEYEDAFIVDNDYSHIYRHINGQYIKAHDEIVA